MIPLIILLCVIVLLAGAAFFLSGRSSPAVGQSPKATVAQEATTVLRSTPISTERVRVDTSASESSPNLGRSDSSDDFQVRATGEVLIAGPQRIIDLVRTLPTLGMPSNEDEARIFALQAVTFRLQFTVDELLDTMSAEQPAMVGGKTAVGSLDDGVMVRVQLSEQYLGSTTEGKPLFVLARVSRWDAPTRSLVLCESVS